MLLMYRVWMACILDAQTFGLYMYIDVISAKVLANRIKNVTMTLNNTDQLEITLLE